MSGPVEDTGPVEFGDVGRMRSGAFPPSWGWAPGRQFSAEREAWVRAHIDSHEARYRKLARANARLASIARYAERLAELGERR